MDLTKYYPDIIAKYPAYVTQRELCEICRICPKTAYNLEQQGEIPYTIEQNHLIRSHKIKLTDILAYLYRRECRQEAGSPYIRAMVHAFEEANDVVVPYQIAARRQGDLPICYADTSKSTELLGWRAEKSLIDMCRDTWNWQKQNPDGYGG